MPLPQIANASIFMLVTVDRYSNPLEAHIVRGRLEAEGITAFVAHEHHVWAKWTIALALGGVKIQVKGEDVGNSLKILENLRNGEYLLGEVESSDYISLCPKCGDANKERINWQWKLALFVLILTSIPLPYSIYRSRCSACSHVWNQKELRGYPIWMPAVAMILIPGIYWVINEAFFYICKINLLSQRCY